MDSGSAKAASWRPGPETFSVAMRAVTSILGNATPEIGSGADAVIAAFKLPRKGSKAAERARPCFRVESVASESHRWGFDFPPARLSPRDQRER